MDVPLIVCLPSLKNLRLQSVTYFNEGSLQRILSNCPVLEDLLVDECEADNMRNFIVIIAYLQRLTLDTSNRLDEFVIDASSLKYLKLEYYNCKSHYCLIENIHKLREAYVDVCFPYIKILIKSITYVKRLSICLIHSISEIINFHLSTASLQSHL